MSKIFTWNKKTGSLAVGIPRKIADAMGWGKGTVLDYEVMGRDALKMFKVKEEGKA